MQSNNIDKEYFNKRFAEYMTISDRKIDNWFYGKYLHDHIRTIIHNVTYHFSFDTEQLLYDDVEAELFIHLQIKKDCFRKYSGNWYNIVFTSFKRKFYDVLRSHKVHDDKIKNLVELCQEMPTTEEDPFYEVEQSIKYNPTPEAPEVLQLEGMAIHTAVETTAQPVVRDMPRHWPAHASKRNRPYRTACNSIQFEIGFFQPTGTL